MRTATPRHLGIGLALALALSTLVGCQTWVPEAGLTLPSGRYLEHPAQYIPRSPAFPLPRELAQQEATAAALGQQQGPAPLPPPAPVVPAPAPQ
jgi:hypothetical protein